MRKAAALIALFLLVALTGRTELTAPHNASGKQEIRGLANAGTNTMMRGVTVQIAAIVLINRNATTTKAVSIYDRSTDCDLGACNLVPPGLEIAAKSVYVIDLPFVKAKDGIVLIAPDATSIEYKIVFLP